MVSAGTNTSPLPTGFLYVLDPMCSWCYAFQPELDDFLEQHANLPVDWILGGLAPDSSEPMDAQLQTTIAGYWHQIEAKTRVTFNHDFWAKNTPYRSTYPSCRAVIAAQQLRADSAGPMVKAIQAAYYQQAKNPSLEDTLVACAGSIGLDEDRFAERLGSAETEQRFQQHLGLTQHLQVRGFPALFLIDDQRRAHPLALGYTTSAELETRFQAVLAASD